MSSLETGSATPHSQSSASESFKLPPWGSGLPPPTGLYDPSNERDSCGVGFTCHIKGVPSHKIVSDARHLLCNMTHRGAVGSDARDGDGAGVMSSIPDKLLRKEFKYYFNVDLPPTGQYATGNFFFKKDETVLGKSKRMFEQLAKAVGLSVLAWRNVPRDSTLLGPASLSREPIILQPAVVMDDPFDEHIFAKKLFTVRKQASSVIGLQNWFYICLLSPARIVYKGQLLPVQVYNYYLDLLSADYEAHFALVHSRFLTNTFPSWDRAQPLRIAAHNGEINTLRGNKNWMRSKEGVMSSSTFGADLEKLFPIIEEGGSDSAAFDNVLELLVMDGVLSLPEAVMLMVPEAWQNSPNMDPHKKAFYEWAACLMEPWDGPALFTFADGRYCGANLDRNGLRPCRYYVLDDDRIVVASEVGVIPLDQEKVVTKGRLQPGRMLLVDTKEGRIVDDEEVKKKAATKADFKLWLVANLVTMEDLQKRLDKSLEPNGSKLDLSLSPHDDPLLTAFGYTREQLGLVLGPMAQSAKEALGSMGNDAPLACLLDQPKLMYEYFRELFAQVTNPPIDPIREAVVMLLECYVGPQGNLLEMKPDQCNRLLLKSPILRTSQLDALKQMLSVYPKWSTHVVDITFPVEDGLLGYTNAIDRICREALEAVFNGAALVVLSDRHSGASRVPVSSLVACGAVHHHLVRQKQRLRVGLIVETAEAREVHHMCVLLGYGADAINPYLAVNTLLRMRAQGMLKEDLTEEQVVDNYVHALDGGILKVMSKMGISTLASYKGAQIFEALGVDNTVVDRCFSGTASRVKGVTFEYIAQDAFTLHERAFSGRGGIKQLPESGEYYWRDGGELHVNDPGAIASIQDAVRNKNEKAYAAYLKKEHEAIKNCTLRGLLDFDFESLTPVPVDQVEPWTEIVRRFVTGAMLYGLISLEAHLTLAVAMNRLGGKSNTGEGGEDSERSEVLPLGDTMRSAIKQIASGRFGVTLHYLADADELQIKMAQGAKPGEGGELPGHKVSEGIAKLRRLTPGVGLISPPPHHDIYLIEDLKQLVYDLKCLNPRARVSVKLVSEVGVGVVAAGVAKAKADHILVSGHDGGTGAARWSGIKYAGLPWELGLAETHQTLVLNDLRGRVTVQTDGQLKTGRDVAIACLLGAEEWGFATAPLIAMGCVMMKRCQANTCPVGIATQDPVLRAKFAGAPEHVVNFFYYVATELREIMAKLGFRTIDEMVGRTEKLKVNDAWRTTKTAALDLSPLLTPAHTIRPGVATRKVKKQDHRLHTRVDNKIVGEAEEALEKGLPVLINAEVVNTDRAVGATISYQVSRKYGEKGLPSDTIHVDFIGSAGQSFGAFLAPGVTLELEGDANDYVGKGLSGGRLVVYPPKVSTFKPEENVIVGNTCLYGATLGLAFFSGIAAERFAVRNSGALAVVEGTGDHGCEYMTGGRVVVLGKIGRNFASGMSGGIAYILDLAQDASQFVNTETVELGKVTDPEEVAFLRGLVEQHVHYTGSEIGKRVLQDFNRVLGRFVRVMPVDYKKVLEGEKKKVEGASSMANVVKVDPESDIAGVKAGMAAGVRARLALKEVELLQDIEETVPDATVEAKKVAKIDKVRGFLKYKQKKEPYRLTKLRLKDWKELSSRLTELELNVQAARCMDCGVPFCQLDTGCPISNLIPVFNELVYQNKWFEALQRLEMTNNFAEVTGRVCPSPCQGACTLNLVDQPVAIKSIECAIIDKGFEMGWIRPRPPAVRTGKRVAIIGSGPAGLACADQLNKAGHNVTVYERSDRPGGLMMYGIPNMKLDKRLVTRRTDLLAEEGVEFVCNTTVGEDISVEALENSFDAVVFAIGLTVARDLRIPGREAEGIMFAMQLLHSNTKALLESDLDTVRQTLEGKNVVVIGGGDTGNDCLGTATRHGAKLVVNFELLPHPSEKRAKDNPWPQWPRVFRVDYGHTEVKDVYGRDPREYCVLSKEFVVEDGRVTGIRTVRVEWKRAEGSGVWQMAEVPGLEELFPADVVLLAMGFVGPELDGFSKYVARNKRGNITTNAGYKVENSKFFAAGDCRRGQLLIVWGIQEGRQCAREVDLFLMGETRLPGSGGVERRDYKLLNELATEAS